MEFTITEKDLDTQKNLKQFPVVSWPSREGDFSTEKRTVQLLWMGFLFKVTPASHDSIGVLQAHVGQKVT